jgi:hypothetical protein|tara:strand:- start:477 stop:1088 length:612 start_codon:yes stop_codon:yes gene_type:complete
MLNSDGVKHELPIASNFDISGYVIKGQQPRSNPLKRRISTEKYVEIPFMLASDMPNDFIPIGRVTLEYDGQEDAADLVYQSLRRSESLEESASNPHLGLVEVQVSRVAKVNSIEVEFNPRRIPNPNKDPFVLSSPGYPDSYRSGGALFYSMSGGEKGYDPAPTVSTGKTVLKNAKTGPVSPKMKAEWDSHLHTFRFCLTNHMT